MKHFKFAVFATALAAIALYAHAAFGAYDSIMLPASGLYTLPSAAKVVSFQGPSAFSLQRIDSYSTFTPDVVTTAETNYTYSIVYTNGVTATTNTVDYSLEPLPSGLVYKSYWTNTVVTATTVTNYTETVTSKTNSLGTATATGGWYFYSSPSNNILPAGTVLRSTSPGSAQAVVIEK